jgi:formimidoylglutamate deiminase
MKLLWTSAAWFPSTETQVQSQASGAWQRDVLFCIGNDGCWSAIHAGFARADAKARGAELCDRPAIAPLVNAHSHAFQRAFVGFAERRDAAQDDFWSWRDRMYRVALAIEPPQLKVIARHLYLELLRGGYTHVCEFQYLHHAKNGSAYGDVYAMSVALIEAANDVGIGITLLPVVYERAGFDAPNLRDDQRRFRADATWVLTAQSDLSVYREMYGERHVLIGAALHSLRAVTAASIARIAATANGPIHIHVAEQRAEVDACLEATGMRPIEYLMSQLQKLSPNKYGLKIVHGTHTTKKEIDAIAQLNGALVICPSTEANLGDGITDVAAWLDANVAMTIGSDSHVGRDWRDELRLLEYGQRLKLERRNVLASPERGATSTATRLYAAAIHGSADAAGLNAWGFKVGARADLLLIDHDDPALCGVPLDHLLDAMIFSSPTRPFNDVMVAGEWILRDGKSETSDAIAREFATMMRSLHS